MKIIFIRHGKTAGNMQGKYIGKTDEPLCEEGIDAIKPAYPAASSIYSSPFVRCLQTAKIIYGNAEIKIIENLKEIDFGDFEGKSYEELKGNADYIRFIDSGGTGQIPNGENTIDFKNRCCEGFAQIVNELKENHQNSAAIVCHGGTIMAILEHFDKEQKGFYEYQVKNGGSYVTEYDLENNMLAVIEKIGE